MKDRLKFHSIVLVVDDEVMIRDIIKGMLVSQGYNLAFASSGTEALAKAAELTPDLILLDVMMPDMNGFEVCRRLRADPHLAEVPIIMVTSLDDRESRLKGIKAGADDFVTKPFDLVELQARVQTITRLNRYRRLLLERSKFEWVVEQDEDGYLMLGERDEILYANPKARLYLGLPANTQLTISETFLEVCRKQYHCEPDAAWAAWPEQSSVESPLYLVHPESSISNGFWLQVDQFEMSPGLNEKYLVRLQNITANVVAQRLTWTFHEQISHKLRTPLTKLTGFLNLLQDDTPMLTDEDKDALLATATRNAMQLQDQILSILHYLQASRTTLPDRSRCRVAELEKVIGQIAANLEPKSINVFYEDLKDLIDTYISASPEIIELILLEIIENAIKFHPERSPEIEIKISKVPTGVRLQIRDDGVTLAPDQLVKMWIPYYQAEKEFSGQVPGMGLGLSMIASLVWTVGGTCRTYNRADRPGMVIELVLPLQAENRHSGND